VRLPRTLNERHGAAQGDAQTGVGVTFGRLVVVAAVDWTDDDWRAGDFRWLVECDCGSGVKVVSGKSLVSGNTRSCGCLARDKSANGARHDFLPAAPVVPYLEGAMSAQRPKSSM
jgi:hypothetical protein